MSTFRENFRIIQCDGGPGVQRGRQETADDSYEEEDEEETSSTSVEEDDDEGEEEEESEQDDTSDSSDDNEVVEGGKTQRPTRNSATLQPRGTSTTEDTCPLQKGRVTRLKAREEMPTKRLLRSRNKSPLPTRAAQVFKCHKCRKEFNNKTSLSRHMGWCKQKPAKEKSPRKKKNEDGGTKEASKSLVDTIQRSPLVGMVSQVITSPVNTTPRGRGRPRKIVPVPLLTATTSSQSPPATGTVITAQEHFIQQRSPVSSPGILDTSSEEDYEQKEFAANAHQLISHRSSVSIDVVNPDPVDLPEPAVDGPVTCPQCNMTYRTLAGYQNHLVSCTPYSSDEDSGEEENDRDVDVDGTHSLEVPQFTQQQNRSTWGVHNEAVSETVIAPAALLQPVATEESSEDSNTSSEEGVGGVYEVAPPSPPQTNIHHIPNVLPQSLPENVPKSCTKVPIVASPSNFIGELRLPLDKTPQVINASGLTVERLEVAPPHPSPQAKTLNSPLRMESTQRNVASPRNLHQIPQALSSTHESPLRPPTTLHHLLPSPSSSQSTYSSSSPLLLPPVFLHTHAHTTPHEPRASLTPTSTPSITPLSSLITSSSPSMSSFPLLQQAQAGVNPPTYTQAQLMPSTVVHNSVMQAQQQMSTSIGDTYNHQHQLVPSQTSQPLPPQHQHFPATHFPLGYNTSTSQSTPQQQHVFRFPNGIPSSLSSTGQHQSPQPQLVPTQQQQHQLPITHTHMLRHPMSLEQQQQLQRMQVPPQQLGQFFNPITGTTGDQTTTVVAAQQLRCATSSAVASGSTGSYGIPMNPNQIVQQANMAMHPGMQIPQLGTVNHSQQHPIAFPSQANLMIPQQQTQNLPGQMPQSVENSQFPISQQLLSQQQQLQYPFLQNPQKMVDAQGHQMQQVPHHYAAMLNGQESQAVISNGALSSTLPLQVQQQANNTPSQQQPLSHSTPQQLNSQVSIFSPQLTENGDPVQQQISQPMLHHNTSTHTGMNLSQGQVELNLQQQAQLEQQQQQFISLSMQQHLLQQQQQRHQQQAQMLQQQRQQQDDPNRHNSLPLQQQPQQHLQIAPHNLQALLMNPSALQWALKPGQPLPTHHQVSSSDIGTPPTQQLVSQQQPNHQSPSSAHHQQQQSLPQVIQQIAQVTDNAGNTYIIIAPTQPQQQTLQSAQNGLSTGNNVSQVLNLVPGLQGIQCQQQQLQRPSSTSGGSQCSATNGIIHQNHSPGSSSFSSVGKSAPCPCASCLEKAATVNPLDKYKKVLPYPSANDQLKPIAPQIAPKQPVSIRPAIPKQPKVIRVQAAATTAQPRPSPPTVALLQPNATSQQGSPLRMVPIPQHPPVGLVAGPNPPTPNIAVVRPMENPLQRLSDQISQIESTFLSTPSSQPPVPPTANSEAPVTVSSPTHGSHITIVTASPPVPESTSMPPMQQMVHVATLDPPSHGELVTEINPYPLNIDEVMNISMPRLGLVDHGVSPVRNVLTLAAASSPQLSSSSDSNAQSPTCLSTAITTAKSGVKRKILQVSPSSASGSGGGGSAAKSIKLLLNRKGGGCSYTINEVAGGASPKGYMRNLKINGKIKSGQQQGTETEVVAVPCIHFVPIPDPDANETERNRTIVEDGGGQQSSTNGSKGSKQGLRLMHRVVIVYEVQLRGSSSEPFRSSDVRAVSRYILETVQGMRLHHNLPPLSYPATNISLPQNGSGKEADWVASNKLGLTHRAIQFLLDEIMRQATPSTQTSSPSTSSCPSPTLTALPHISVPTATLPSLCPSPLSSPASFPTPTTADNEEEEGLPEENPSGCARFERFMGRKQFDMFGWLASKHRKSPMACNAPMESMKSLSAPMSMRFRKLKDKSEMEHLVVWWSTIHGRGLYTRRDIGKGEMIIEYAGEVIRSLVCDIREKYYESKAIGCYMFRINDHVIDATMRGNAARFINHACEPNCEAKAIKISGKHHIVIFALRQIGRGEELTYDYKFEKEEEKIPCTCGSIHCRKYLN